MTLVSSAFFLALLLAASLTVGIISKKKSETFEKWLAGSGFGPVITGLALAATWLSGWACLGLMGIVYTFGWAGMWLAGVWTLVGIIPTVTIFGPRLRKKFEELKALTVPQLVGELYGSKFVAALSSLVYVILLFVYSVGQYKAAATAWHVATATPWEISLLIATFVMAFYMVVGGYTGTQWALAVQAIFIGVACYLLAFTSLSIVGGIEGLNKALASQDLKLLQPIRPDITRPNLQFVSDLIGISATLGLFITMAVGFPHNVARFIGMRKISRRDLALMTFSVLIIASVPFANILTGLSARAVFGTELFNYPFAKQDAAAPMMALKSGEIVTGLYVSAVYAAAISTLAGMILVIAGSLTRDVIQYLKPDLDQKILLRIAKILTVIFSILPLIWVFFSPPPLLAYLMAGAAVGMGCIFFFTLALTLFWNKANKFGAIACIVYGFTMTALGGYYVYTVNQWGWGYWWWATFLGCAFCYTVFSLIGSKIKK